MLRDRLNPPLLDEGNWYGTATTNSGASTPIFARSRDVVANAVRRLPELLLTATNASAKDKTETESKTGANEAKTKSQRVEKGGESHIDILPQFHCYGLVVVFVALHTVSNRRIVDVDVDARARARQAAGVPS